MGQASGCPRDEGARAGQGVPAYAGRSDDSRGRDDDPSPGLGAPRERGRPRGARRGDLGRQPEVPQDPRGHGACLQERHEPQPPATARTGQHVDLERPPHQVRPAPSGRTWRRRVGGVRCRACGRSRAVRRRPRHDFSPPRGIRCQDAVIEQQIDPRPWYQHRQPLEKRCRLESDMRSAVGPRMTEPEHHASVGCHAQAIARHRRAQDVATQTLESRPMARYGDPCVQVEPLPPGMGRLGARLLPRAPLSVTEPVRPAPRYAAQRQDALDRRRRQPGQARLRWGTGLPLSASFAGSHHAACWR